MLDQHYQTINSIHLELPVALTPAAKGSEEGAIRVEDLDSVVS